jgi:hypothetical protein
MSKPSLSFRILTQTLLVALLSGVLLAQSTTNGAINGTVTDASGAVLPGITVNLKSTDKGFTTATKTNSQGFYQFPLLEPGTYSLTISAPSFRTLNRTMTVSVGATAIINAQMEVGAAGTTVEVSGQVPLLQTESSEVTTTFDAREISEVPNPGNDLSFVAQTAAGSVMNTGSGYGNFSSFGVSATSNLFTLNGMYDNDPFLNLNNSGATNLLLGNNEVQEATVVTNGYSGQYGGFAGANVNYITKSGGNNWHGNANYWWDGRVMNANNFFNKDTTGPITPRPFVNANQYAASFGGPIVKDKAFFFWNYEGLRVLIPTSSQVQVPSPQFETATIDNLNATGLSQSVPFYQNMFTLYNGANGISRAVQGVPSAQDTTGCGGQTFTDPAVGTLGGAGGLPCALTFRSTAGNFTHEYLTSGRFDFNITNNDKVFIRLQEDKGVQATATDAINPLFNATSTQPEYQGQVSWNRSFGTRAANNLVVAANWYSAIFAPLNLQKSLAAFPTTILMGDGTFNNMGGINYIWPQGRNVTGYQVVDDYSYNLTSAHTLKFGLYYHRNDISDHDYGLFTSGLLIPFSIGDLYSGGATGDELLQNFPTKLNQPIRLYQLGLYAQDEWRVRPGLKITLALRADHNSNPYCITKCFGGMTSSFDRLNHDPTIPYNQAIKINQAQAIPSFTNISWQPRFGFSWTPFGLKNTVLRGGVGMFMDTFPGQIADSLSSNMPLLNPFILLFNNISPQQVAGSGNIFADAANSNAALVAGFSSGGTLASIQASDPAFSPPSFNNVSTIKAPTYTEWNLEVQQAIGNNTSLIVNYVGNHGIHETVFFNGINAYCPPSTCPNGFAGLPAAAPDARFGTVGEYRTAGISNYNGLSVSAQHRFSKGLQLQVNYTWSHALDDVSNGGFNPFISNNAGIGRVGSLLFPVNNNNLRQYNYGNADYDTRHYLSMNYVYELPKGPTLLLKGWQLSGTLFTRSGLPFTVVDTATSNPLSGFNYGGASYANFTGASYPTCSGPKGGATQIPCLPASEFSSPIAQTFPTYGTQRRNQFFGPHYFDTDMTIMKYTMIPHWESAKFGFGAQFFNLFNHPNFQSPVNDLNNGNFGQTLDTVNTPTSILGSFLGGDASPRLIQLTVKLNF